MGWTINSVCYANNPISVTMSKNVLATPVFKKSSGSTGPDPTSISMAIGLVAGKPTVSIRGELGAWALEGSADRCNWIQVPTCLTSDQVAMDATTPCGF